MKSLGTLAVHLGLSTLLAGSLGTPIAMAQDRSTSVEQQTERRKVTDLAQLKEEMIPIVEELRGLEFKGPVAVSKVGPMEMMMKMAQGGGAMPNPAMMKDMFEQMARERVIAGAIGLVPEAQALGALDDEGKLRSGFGPGGFGGEGFGPGGCGAPPPGFGPDGAGLGGIPTGLLGAAYDDQSKQILLIANGELDWELTRRVLAHELTHALDDQHYDLARGNQNQPQASPMAGMMSMFREDSLMAYMSLVEGSAMTVEIDWTRRVSGESGEIPQFGGIVDGEGQLVPPPGAGPRGPAGGHPGMPPALGKTQVFPYAFGFEFVRHLRQEGVDLAAVFAKPPTTTEQILHPERYLDRDHPSAVKLVDWQSLLDDPQAVVIAQRKLGEFGIRTVLDHAGVDSPERAAAGWDGDQLTVVWTRDRLATVHASTWDSAEEAAEFAEAARAFLDRRYGERSSIVLRHHTEVLFLGGFDPATTQAFEAASISQLLQVSM